MGKTVRRRHNKDGSVTTTTTYSRKNIFGTRITDTYTERVDADHIQRAFSSQKIRKSNSAAIIILVIAIFVVPILGISLSWNADIILGIVKFSVLSFAIYMVFNNITPLRRLVIKCWQKNRKATILSIAAVVVFIAIISAIPMQIDSNQVDSNQSTSSPAPATTVAEQELTAIADENDEQNEYAADDLVNRFITEFNSQSAYPITDISQGNIRTKYYCTSHGCRIEIINATTAAADTFNVSIGGGNADDGEEKMFNVFIEAVKILDPSVTDEQINIAITEFADGGKLIENYILGDNISITYIPSVELSQGKNNRRIDIAAANYK